MVDCQEGFWNTRLTHDFPQFEERVAPCTRTRRPRAAFARDAWNGSSLDVFCSPRGSDAGKVGIGGV